MSEMSDMSEIRIEMTNYRYFFLFSIILLVLLLHAVTILNGPHRILDNFTKLPLCSTLDFRNSLSGVALSSSSDDSNVVVTHNCYSFRKKYRIRFNGLFHILEAWLK